jgi:hypothetical protein
MEKKDLRTVIYTLGDVIESGVDPYLTPEEREIEEKEEEELTKERQGSFHCWGNEILYENEQPFQNTFGIVEDKETGKKIKLAPDRIKKFID